jgi:hypothetical protein
MDIPVILIKITGVTIFLFTVRGIYLHIKKESKEAKAARTQSNGEKFLNGIIFYLWLIFIIAFSLGMIFNN